MQTYIQRLSDEDAYVLYRFLCVNRHELFLLLISVSGIGEYSSRGFSQLMSRLINVSTENTSTETVKYRAETANRIVWIKDKIRPAL